MSQRISSAFVMYRHKTLTGSPDPTHANGTDKGCKVETASFPDTFIENLIECSNRQRLKERNSFLLTVHRQCYLMFTLSNDKNQKNKIAFAFIFTVHKRSCGKVMFLHLSVSHSVHRGGSASVHAGIPPPWDQVPPQDQTPLEQTPPQQTATAVDGTHPSDNKKKHALSSV